VVSDKCTRKIKVLSQTCEGKKHDKKLADEQNLRFPTGSKVWKDTGFQGYEPEDVTTYQPRKKPKGKELTLEEKEQNRVISSERSGVEHSLGGVKVFAIVREIYRNMTTGFEDLIIEAACGLHNLRLDYPLSA
jgi:DDE superfamily endonuclease